MPDRPLPSDRTAERDLVGAVLQCHDALFIERLVPTVPATAFVDDDYRKCWGIVADLSQAGELDRMTFYRTAERDGLTQQATALMSWSGSPATHAIQATANRVADCAYRRMRILEMHGSIDALHDDRRDIVEIEDAADKARAELAAQYAPPVGIDTAEASARLVEYRKTLNKGKSAGATVNTGIGRLDLHGPVPPEYCVVAARTSVGKTALAVSMAVNMAKSGKRVFLWSGEQPVRVLHAKLISALSWLPLGVVLEMHEASPDQWEALATAEATIQKLPITYLEGRRTFRSVAAFAERLKRGPGLDAIFLDQLDKFVLPSSGRVNKEQMLAGISASCADLALGLCVPVFLLAQLGIKHQDKHPTPEGWQIRDCSQVNQDAHRLYVIDRPEAEPDRWAKMTAARDKARRSGDIVPDLTGKARIILEKNQNGIGGTWSEIVSFDKACGRFA